MRTGVYNDVGFASVYFDEEVKTTDSSTYILLFAVVILLCWIIPAANKRYYDIIRKKKGKKKAMPTELIKEFIGKMCTIGLFNDSFGVQGRITAVEGNWIRVEEKKGARLINGDMIRDIKLVPEKK